MHRRSFIKTTGVAAVGMGAFSSFSGYSGEMIRGRQKKITINSASANFEREPLIRPFGFKGGYMTEIWQTASLLESNSGIRKIFL